MELIYDYWKGNFDEVKEMLAKSIAQYVKTYQMIKIGITSNPNNRKYQHQADELGWKKMIVKYETNSVTNINKMEKVLIKNHWKYIANENEGGGGPNTNTGPYYLYVLLK